MLRSLDLPRADALADLSLLEATYRPGPASVSFWRVLLADAGLGDGRLKSRPGQAIELYGDAIARHAASGRIALSVLDSRGAFQHLSFAELDAAAGACAAAWSLEGLEPGQVLAIAAPMGVDWLIAFAAALRLGLVVSCLGSLGEQALCRRLRGLDPRYIVFDSAGPAPPAEFAERSLSVVRSAAAHAPPARAYSPQQAFGKLFSPVRAPVDRPSLLCAETALLWALRDARFAYRLAPGSGLAMPGFHFEQHQPALILSTLLAGARFVDLPVSAVAQSPALLAQPFITTLGVSPALRDVLRRTPLGSTPELRDWWRSVDEPFDWMAWQDFVEKNELNQLPAGNVLVDSASGGALLTSARRPGVTHAFALPSPGVPFTLADLSAKSASLTDCGVFSSGAQPDAKHPGWFLLLKRASEYLYGSTVLPRRAGRVYPEDEVVECVAQLPGVDGACVVPLATNDVGIGWAFVLVVFAGTLPERSFEALRRVVESAIRTRLGSDFAPNHLLVFPLHARRKGQELDTAWCRDQYSKGFLQRKASLPIFQSLTALRASLMRVSEDVR